MNLEFKGQERIPVPRERVWSFINDPNSIARCLPDVQDITIVDAHSFDALVQVAVGPVRGKLKFKVALDPQSDGNHMNMRINGGGFGSVIDLNAGAALSDDGAGGTTLDWQGTATARGPIATVGGRVMDAQAQRVIASTFGNIKENLTGSGAASP